MIEFPTATRERLLARIALEGGPGDGKTMTALRLAYALAAHYGWPELNIIVVDSENGTAANYAHLPEFQPPFRHHILEKFDPEHYAEVIRQAALQKPDILILDGISHEWIEALDMADRLTERAGGNQFGAWRFVTPKHNAFIRAMTSIGTHLIVTMRTKPEYLQERDEKTGKTKIRLVGVEPIQRNQVPYEFDDIFLLEQANATVVKSRNPNLLKGQVFDQPGEALAAIIYDWLKEGVPRIPREMRGQTELKAAPAPTPPMTRARPKRSPLQWWNFVKDYGAQKNYTEDEIKSFILHTIGKPSSEFSDDDWQRVIDGIDTGNILKLESPA